MPTLALRNGCGIFRALLRPPLKAEFVGRSAKLDGSIQLRLTKYFETSAFEIPAPFTFGNVSRTLPDVRGPGRANYNLTLSKAILIRALVSLQFRAETLNLTITPYFGNPAEAGDEQLWRHRVSERRATMPIHVEATVLEVKKDD